MEDDNGICFDSSIIFFLVHALVVHLFCIMAVYEILALELSYALSFCQSIGGQVLKTFSFDKLMLLETKF
jgi:hypothetical protein